MLALEWYAHTPLPDALPEKPRPATPTELSRRLSAVFDAGEHTDVQFCAGASQTEALGAHRLVLRRNPALGFERDAVPASMILPTHVPTDTLRLVLRAHYLEVDGELSTPGLGPRAALQEARRGASAQAWESLEAMFGPLDAESWAPLQAAVQTSLFADISLELSGGFKVPAHRCMLAGPQDEDGHYFAAAFRWPGDSSGAVITMPEGLSEEATMMLLRLRYGSEEVQADYILEARHFAELLDWPDVRKRCEAYLESLLVKSEDVDTASLLAVLSHAEESRSMPGRLKAAALAAAVRQWSRVAEAAEAENLDTVPASRRSELGTLDRIRRRDGHVCGSLEEYLHAAADDLVHWEQNLALDAPQSAKRKLEGAWQHWHQILFEYGHISGAEPAEKLRERVRLRRAGLREERSRQRGQDLRLPAGKIWFEATTDWQEVPPNAICAAGLEYRCDMQTGRNFARLAM